MTSDLGGDMMSRHLPRLRAIISSPYTQLMTGVILLVSGCATTYYEFAEVDHSFRLGVHHGIVIWAAVQILGSLPDLIEGIDRSIDAIETKRQS